ncbi:MAG TPA: F0F1 ATP synthase subunit A [Acidimicrobiales bacterium]
MFAIDFPPVSHVIEWPEFFLEGTPFAVSKVVVLMWISALIAVGFVILAGRNFKMVPSPLQNMGESLYSFIQEGIILETMGPDGLKYTSFLGSLFVFVLSCNVWGIVPFAQMPVNARIALPFFLAMMIWVIFVVVGIKKQGPLTYLKNTGFPPGVPWPLYFLVTPIELVSTFIVRPLSMFVRLFANMLAGHLLLTSFAVICAALFSLSLSLVILPFSFGLLAALTGFEILVAFLQAFIFTILAAVYIGSSMHPEH